MIVAAASFSLSASLAASATVAVPYAGGTVPPGSSKLLESSVCQPDWLPTFGSRGIDGPVDAMAVYDDGSGPALYVGGNFTTASGASARSIAKWDGARWSALPSEVDGPVRALVVHDDGTGPALYAGGDFTMAGGATVNRIARWDGTSWSALGSGVSDAVNGLAVHDDGSGPALYATGEFVAAGGLFANHVAKWDGLSWSALGTGVTNGASQTYAYALATHDDGSGPALYLGGLFTTAGGVTVNHVARWDGTSWSALSSGMNAFGGYVYDLFVFDDGLGAGPALYAGGYFTTAGGVAVNRIAKWTGTTWSALGGGMNSWVKCLTSYDDGSGPALYAGGNFTTAGGASATRVARWNGTSWSALDSGPNGPVRSLAGWDGIGGGTALYVGGAFSTVDGTTADNIVAWQADAWSTLGNGVNEAVQALAVWEAPGGPALYAGGLFWNAGELVTNRIAKWNGVTWSGLGSGVTPTAEVLALAVHDDGGGLALYAGGNFTTAGGMSANRIAKWNGSSWSALGSGTSGPVRAIAEYDDGAGSALYAAGHFATAGGASVSHIARWNGASWSALGTGTSSTVDALAVYDDGAGAALYAGGDFGTAGGVSANRIARWDGVAWSALGSGLNSSVRALAVFDDGGGAALYAGGDFTVAGGVSASRIAKWDGTSWSALGSGFAGSFDTYVHALTVYDDGAGPALYAGGSFTIAGGVSASRIGKWDGASWSALGAGTDDPVVALCVFDDGGSAGPSLIAGGSFEASPAGDAHLARFGGCASPLLGSPYCFGDGSATACPCGNTGGSGQGCANSTGVGASLFAEGSASVSADDLTCTGDDLRPNQAALLFSANNAVNGGNGIPFGAGLRCAGGAERRLGVRQPNAAGIASWGPGLGAVGGWQPGDMRRFQIWYRDPGGPCGSAFNLSNGCALLFTN